MNNNYENEEQKEAFKASCFWLNYLSINPYKLLIKRETLKTFVKHFMSALNPFYKIIIIVENKESKKVNIAGNTEFYNETLNLIHAGLNHYTINQEKL